MVEIVFAFAIPEKIIGGRNLPPRRRLLHIEVEEEALFSPQFVFVAFIIDLDVLDLVAVLVV